MTSQRKAISDAKKGVHVGGIQTMLYSLDVRMEEESFIIHLKKTHLKTLLVIHLPGRWYYLVDTTRIVLLNIFVTHN